MYSMVFNNYYKFASGDMFANMHIDISIVGKNSVCQINEKQILKNNYDATLMQFRYNHDAFPL